MPAFWRCGLASIQTGMAISATIASITSAESTRNSTKVARTNNVTKIRAARSTTCLFSALDHILPLEYSQIDFRASYPGPNVAHLTGANRRFPRKVQHG